MAYFTTMMLMMFAATVTLGAKTPAAVPEAGGMVAAMTPEELDAMSAEHVASTAEHKQSSLEHFEIHKTAQANMEHEAVRAQQFGEVEEAHVQASDAHTVAGQLAKLAAESRDRANKAVAARDVAKELLEEKKKERVEAQTVAQEMEKLETQTKVTLETKEERTKTSKEELGRDEGLQKAAREELKKADNEMFSDLKDSEEADQQLAAAQEEAVQKGAIMDELTAQFDAATAKLNTLLVEETDLSQALGEKEATSATESTKNTKCEQDRALAKEAYDEAQKEASRLDADAVRAETKAQGIAATANSQAAKAKVIADSVGAASAPAGS